MSIDSKLLDYCETDTQIETVEAVLKYGSHRKAAKELDKNSSTITKCLKLVKLNAAKKGYAPDKDFTHPAAEGFNVKRVSTAYKASGEIALQWVIQEPEKQRLAEILNSFRDGLKDEFKGVHTPIPAPEDTLDNLMNCYMIGDHHLGMYAWGAETGGEDYDTDLGVEVLEGAVDSLVARSPNAKQGLLCNLGDFFHSNNLKSETGSGTALDSDGRYGRTVRKGINLLKRLIVRLLEKHEIVTVMNVRGNHDPDAALWLNEALKMYFQDDPRVIIPDNYNKFLYYEWGNSLIVLHHGDRITPQRIYEAVTRNLPKEWGRTAYKFGWLGHLHHKEAKEIGGMLFEQWNVLAPPDAWHASCGFGSSRSMTCVVLNESFGEESRVTINPERLKNDI